MLLEPIWSGETAVILATGPSLCAEDVEAVRGRARVIAVNDAYRLAPWADILYACDAKWWNWHKGVPTFAGMKLSLRATKYPDVHQLTDTGETGLEIDRRDGLRTGKNSGYQAINVAVHLGATRIILLGYDMQGGHFFGSHPDGTRNPFPLFLRLFETIVEPLQAAGVEVINCTRRTVLPCFPRRVLDEVIVREVAA